MKNHQARKKIKSKSDQLKFFKLTFIIFTFNFSVLVVRADEQLLIAIASTVENTGLAKELINNYQNFCSCEVRYIATGSTRAINLLDNNDVDMAITHAPSLEDEFISNNHNFQKINFMYNEFILVGEDNSEFTNLNIAKVMQEIYNQEKLFITRNDGSGTNLAEIKLWQSFLNEVPSISNWYQAAGVQMSQALLIANQKNAYTLTDMGTYIYMLNAGLINAKIVARNKPPLINTYSLLYQIDNHSQTNKFVAWIKSASTKEIINKYTSNQQQLFFAL